MTDFLNVLKDVYVYWLVYAACFLVSLTFMEDYFRGEQRKDFEKLSDLVSENRQIVNQYNELVSKYNELCDKYDELRGYYTKTYERYEHILRVDQEYNGKSIVTFTQIFYPANKEMLIISTRFHKSGKVSNHKLG